MYRLTKKAEAQREKLASNDCDDNEKCDIIAASFAGPVPEWIYNERPHDRWVGRHFLKGTK